MLVRHHQIDLFSRDLTGFFVTGHVPHIQGHNPGCIRGRDLFRQGRQNRSIMPDGYRFVALERIGLVDILAIRQRRGKPAWDRRHIDAKRTN
jgi:hypothetical protein